MWILSKGPVKNKGYPRCAWVAQLVECLTFAQVMISGSWDPALSWAPCSAGSLLLSLLFLPLIHTLSFSLSSK